MLSPCSEAYYDSMPLSAAYLMPAPIFLRWSGCRPHSYFSAISDQAMSDVPITLWYISRTYPC